MKLSEYCALDALALAELVRKGAVHPQEVLACAGRASEQVNPQINALAELYPDRLEGGARHRMSGLFAGVPFLLKDTGSGERGRLQQCGSRIGAGYRCPRDSHLAELYRHAGLVTIGRSTAPELAMAATTESELYGPTRNPWNLELSTGGSSGGAAAAVAAGIVPIAHGTDTGGSIRIPAACCGLVGLKPSRGRMSKGPDLDETLYAGLNTEHVITRSVRDCAAALDISCLPMPGDHPAPALPPGGFLAALDRETGPLRIALTLTTFAGEPVDPEVRLAVEAVADHLGSSGHNLLEAMPGFDLEACASADDIVWQASTYREVQRLSRATGRTVDARHLEPPVLEACERGARLGLNEWINALSTHHQVRQAVDRFFADYDLLLTPTLRRTAPELGTINSNRPIDLDSFMADTVDLCPHTPLFNVTGHPALSLPLGLSSTGMPIGAQFVARHGEEALLLRLGAALEQSSLWLRQPPPVHASADHA